LPASCSSASADLLGAVETAAALLGGHDDPAVRAIGGWLASYPAELLAELGFANGVGHSARQAAAIARRDELLRSVRLPASRLLAELSAYRANRWPRDRIKDRCPYPPEDRREAYWRALRLVDRPLGLRRLRQIVQ
jgi:hypothetical protein